MATSAEQKRIANYLNLGVWSSASRINASAQFEVLAAHDMLIPPDVAAVSMALLEYEKSSFGRMVNGLLLPNDAALTEWYAASRPEGAPALPSGTSFLQPWQDQLDQLNAAAIVPDEWVWHDMPSELYLINDPALSPVERQILADLGFADAAAAHAAGQKVYTANPEAIALADANRSALTAKVGAAAVRATIWSFAKLTGKILGYALVPAFGALIIWKTVGACLDRWVHGDQWKAEASKAESQRLANQQVLLRTQALAADLERCREEAAAGLRTVESCDDMARALGQLQPVVTPEGVPSLPSCGFTNCWPYALLALAGGGLLGYGIAKKKGWI